MSGSAVVNLIYLFSGRIDGYYEKYLNIWDIAASIIILKEAGGCISDLGKEFSLKNFEYFICASHPNLLKEIQQQIME